MDGSKNKDFVHLRQWRACIPSAEVMFSLIQALKAKIGICDGLLVHTVFPLQIIPSNWAIHSRNGFFEIKILVKVRVVEQGLKIVKPDMQPCTFAKSPTTEMKCTIRLALDT